MNKAEITSIIDKMKTRAIKPVPATPADVDAHDRMRAEAMAIFGHELPPIKVGQMIDRIRIGAMT